MRVCVCVYTISKRGREEGAGSWGGQAAKCYKSDVDPMICGQNPPSEMRIVSRSSKGGGGGGGTRGPTGRERENGNLNVSFLLLHCEKGDRERKGGAICFDLGASIIGAFLCLRFGKKRDCSFLLHCYFLVVLI